MSGESLADRARRVAQRPTPEAPVVAPRATPIRVTTDLAPQSYRALAAFASEVAAVTGQPRIFHTDLLRALVAELETSPELRAAVTRRLRA